MKRIATWQTLLLAGMIGWLSIGPAWAEEMDAGTFLEGFVSAVNAGETLVMVELVQSNPGTARRWSEVLQAAGQGDGEQAQAAGQLAERLAGILAVLDGTATDPGEAGPPAADAMEPTALDEVQRLNKLGQAAQRRADYPAALAAWQQGLEIALTEELKQAIGVFLGNIGVVLDYLGRSQEALSHYEQALAIRREIGDRRGEGVDLGNIGIVHYNLGRYQEALSHCEQALAIRREIGDRDGEATDLLNLGVLHGKQGHTTEALARYREALAIQAEVGRPETLWRLWNNLRQLWSAADQPGPAIVAGKRAVNTIQAMRAASGGLDWSMQQSFLEDKEHVYRGLADDLIGQGRIPEAEQVLAMLKEEELYDYIRRRDGAEGIRDTRASLTAAEQAWDDRYQSFSTDLVRLAGEYRALKAVANRSAAEQTRLEALKTELKDARRALLAALAEEFSNTGGERALAYSDAALKQLRGQQRTLRAMGHGAVIISTIMAEDRLHLILTTPNVQLARQSPIGFEALSTLVNQFRAVLKDRHADPLPLARELYGHLIAPIAEDLQQANAETLMVSLDGPLRYIPLAALHDGGQWLMQRWRLAVYNQATADKLSAARIGDWQVAGLGVSLAHPPFQALEAVPGELEGIVKKDALDADGVIAGQVHLDAAFDAERLIDVLEAQDDYPVLHLASHFSLNPGDTSASFLLLGDGSHLSLDAIDTDPDYELYGIDLLTLSACNTAMGASSGAGAEIESFGALAQLRGARGVQATLWPVADASTGQLMQTLYRLRGADSELTKAEALGLAQMSLLQGDDSAQTCSTSRSPVSLSGADNTGAAEWRVEPDDSCRWSHPYYWAPFILMGNWL